jgi:hypothetical protein
MKGAELSLWSDLSIVWTEGQLCSMLYHQHQLSCSYRMNFYGTIVRSLKSMYLCISCVVGVMSSNVGVSRFQTTKILSFSLGEIV